jgi:solute carrier family 45 protein 1/2/4
MGDTTDKPGPVPLHEGSPLMTGTHHSGDHGLRSHLVVDESSKSIWYLILLTLSIGG